MRGRELWVRRHCPVHTAADPASPFSVGNGDFAFTADVTGLQTLYDAYAKVTPLCTMANWGWHSTPAPVEGGAYTLSDVQMTHYDHNGRDVVYAKERFPGNEPVYDWLRQNPHKADLARIGLRMGGRDITPEALSSIHQRLDLWSGVLESRYDLLGQPCEVRTCCAPERDVLAFVLRSPLFAQGLSVDIDLPLGSPLITGADWENEQAHTTGLAGNTVSCAMDDLRYHITLNAPGAEIRLIAPHRVRITPGGEELLLTCAFGLGKASDVLTPADVEAQAAAWWHAYWQKGSMVDLSAATHPAAPELERRMVLSLYLLAIQSAGHMPPAETGLTCNSWYGKAHLEMHFWHMAWAPLWGHGDLLMRSLPWYHAHLPEARENARRNGYQGARWPKMVGDTAQDSPSSIAVLLVWQQPHILLLLELLRRTGRDDDAFLAEQWPLVSETADFMADLAAFDLADGRYHLDAPLIPVQESYDPETVRDPAFEAAYWAFGLSIAVRWAERLGKPVPNLWRDVRDHMAPPPVSRGLYIAHAYRSDTFENVHVDHPSMLQCLGMLPGEGIDREIMRRTLERVLDCWDYESLWGWDFAVMAMTAARLGDASRAFELLMMPTAKNTYVESGNNRQSTRADLPLYLPGNGSLLLAAALLFAGGDASPAADGWQAKCEGLFPYV